MVENNNPFLSIITPCYNAEKFLSQSIESVQMQKFKNWELILVDDGSADKTMDICNGYAAKDQRIHVIHQENQGVSAARNRALREAKGEYISFIDSDDWYASDAFEIFLRSISKYGADRYTFKRWTYNNGRLMDQNLIPDELVRSGEQLKWTALQMIYPYYDEIKNGVVVVGTRGVNCNIYRKSILVENNLLFKEGMKVGEDALFNYEFVQHAKKAVMLNEYVGYYRINQDSVMHKANPDILHINDVTIENFLKATAYYKTDEDYQCAFLGMAAECIFRAYKLLILNNNSKMSFFERKNLFKDWLATPYISEVMRCNDINVLPKGKKQIVKYIKNGNLDLSLLFGWLAIRYLKFKGEL